MAATPKAQTLLGLAAAAIQPDGRKISNETAAISATAVVHSGVSSNGNESGSGRRCELGVTRTA